MSEISTIQISYSSVSDSFLYTGQKYLENTAAQHNRMIEREGHPFLLPHFDCLSIIAEKSNDMSTCYVDATTRHLLCRF